MKEKKEFFSRQARRKLHREALQKAELYLFKLYRTPEYAKQSKSLLGVSDF